MNRRIAGLSEDTRMLSGGTYYFVVSCSFQSWQLFFRDQLLGAKDMNLAHAVFRLPLFTLWCIIPQHLAAAPLCRCHEKLNLQCVTLSGTRLGLRRHHKST